MARPTLNKKAPVEVVENFEPIAVQYRPQEFDQLYGNEAVVKSIEKGLNSNRPPRAYIFTGPSGCGKTTLARIIAKHHKIPRQNIVEVDAATYSSIDNIRQVTDTIRFVGPGSNRRMIIVDEAHGLSKQAWSALLKPIEEAKEGLYWALCTTEAQKIPATIKTRCKQYTVKALTIEQMMSFLTDINEIEELGCSPGVLEVIADDVHGSPRDALQRLEQVRDVTNSEEAAEILTNTTKVVEAIDLIKMIINRQGFTWTNAIKLLRKLEAQEPESTRLICLAYAGQVLLNAKSDRSAPWLLTVMDAFSKPMYGSEKMAPLLLAVGRLCFGEDEGE